MNNKNIKHFSRLPKDLWRIINEMAQDREITKCIIYELEQNYNKCYICTKKFYSNIGKSKIVNPHKILKHKYVYVCNECNYYIDEENECLFADSSDSDDPCNDIDCDCDCTCKCRCDENYDIKRILDMNDMDDF